MIEPLSEQQLLHNLFFFSDKTKIKKKVISFHLKLIVHSVQQPLTIF